MRKPIATEILLYDWAKLHNWKTAKKHISRLFHFAPDPCDELRFQVLVKIWSTLSWVKICTFSPFFSEKSQTQIWTQKTGKKCTSENITQTSKKSKILISKFLVWGWKKKSRHQARKHQIFNFRLYPYQNDRKKFAHLSTFEKALRGPSGLSYGLRHFF